MIKNFNVQWLIDQFNRLDVKLRYTAFGVCLLLVVVLDFALITRFQLGSLAAMDAQSKKINEDTQKLKQDKERIGQIRQGLERARLQIKQLDSKIRPVFDSAVVMEEMSRVANENHVIVDQVTPSKEGQENLVTVENIKYFALPIVLSAHSGYHMFGRFLNKLQSDKLLFLVKSLKMDGGDKENANITIIATLKVIMSDKPVGSQ